MPHPEFHQMRRKDRQVSHEEALAILAKGSYGVLCTTGENGWPSGTPLNYADNGAHIYVHFATGQALANVRHNPKVGFTVVSRSDVVESEFVTNYESVMVHGTAEELDGEDKFAGLRLLAMKYSAKFEKEGIEHIKEDIDKCHVLRIHIDNVTGKARRG